MQISRFNTFSLPLKSGILAGSITISASAGIFTVLTYRNEIFNSVENRYIQSKEFMESKVFPIFQGYYDSLNSMFSKHKEGFDYLLSNWETISKSLKIQNIIDGHSELKDKLFSGYLVFKDFLKELSVDNIRKFIYQMNNVSYNVISIISLFKGFMENYLSGENKITLPSNISLFLSSAGSLFADNSKIISQLKEDDFQNIINFMSESPDEFSKRIMDKRGQGNWGNYPNKTEFLNDILPPQLALEALLKRVSVAFLKCQKENNIEESCGIEYASYEDLIEFSKLKENKEFMKTM